MHFICLVTLAEKCHIISHCILNPALCVQLFQFKVLDNMKAKKMPFYKRHISGNVLGGLPQHSTPKRPICNIFCVAINMSFTMAKLLGLPINTYIKIRSRNKHIFSWVMSLYITVIAI